MPILLTTKLNIPRQRPALVPRTRLTQRLTEGLYRKLTLVSAPAGFGKTTLLSAWAQAQTQPVAWLSLDEGDNDPARFVSYLVAALRTHPALTDALDALGERSTGALQSSRLETAITALVNALNAQTTHCILVLDDYHVIYAPEIHEALAFLLAHQPATLHLILATRSDPPLPLARLRVRDQLTELRAADLRFTHAEAAEFLNHVMGLTLSSEDVNVLAERTEGWIAGL